MMLRSFYIYVFLLAWTAVAQADDLADAKKKLAEVMPGVSIDSIQALDNTGLYEVVIKGEILYFSQDMRYAIQGDVIELASRENITEVKRLVLRKAVLDAVDDADMIIYTPQKKTDYTVTVFTDIDCGYCRKLHNQMAEYNALGIRIQYLAYPRAGIDSEAYEKAVDVWCADDRKQAMTDAKNGLDVNSKHCEAPISSQYRLGRKLGVNGTPSLFLEDGSMLPGYVPPEKLRKELDRRAALK